MGGDGGSGVTRAVDGLLELSSLITVGTGVPAAGLSRTLVTVGCAGLGVAVVGEILEAMRTCFLC